MAEKRIARARNIDAFMTAVFYAIAIFFFTCWQRLRER